LQGGIRDSSPFRIRGAIDPATTEFLDRARPEMGVQRRTARGVGPTFVGLNVFSEEKIGPTRPTEPPDQV
jgi:hypothetical protein